MIDGIILRKQPYQETSELITIFTREYGKLNVLARSAKKPSNPLFSAVQLYEYGSYDIYLREGLSTLYRGEKKTIYRIQTDLLTQTAYAYIGELVLYSFDERIAFSWLFDWIVEAFTLLENKKAVYYVLARTLYYFQKIVDEPFFYRECSRCHQKDKKMIGFSMTNHGFVCERCQDGLVYPVEKQLIRLIIALDREEILDQQAITHPSWELLFNAYRHYFKETLGIIPKSSHVLNQLK